MVSYLVAVILGFFVFAEARSRCFARHALLAATLPIGVALATCLLPLLGLHLKVGVMFNEYLVVDAVALACGIAGFIAARTLIPRLAAAYARHWDSLTAAL